MNFANAREELRLISSKEPQFSDFDKPIPSKNVPRPQASYSLGCEEAWPDKGLNRILATLESFNSNDLSEIECLEMLFYLTSRRSDARRLAESAIDIYGSLAKVFQRPGYELRDVLGVDRSVTSVITITKSSMKYLIAPQSSERRDISSFAALISYLSLDLREAEQEILRVLYLDTKSRLIKDEEMARGTVNAVPIYPKEVGKRALSYCASSVILAHNHLSDDPRPSNDDIKATLKTKWALEQNEIVLHDHVIIARSRYYSMDQHGMI